MQGIHVFRILMDNFLLFRAAVCTKKKKQG